MNIRRTLARVLLAAAILLPGAATAAAPVALGLSSGCYSMTATYEWGVGVRRGTISVVEEAGTFQIQSFWCFTYGVDVWPQPGQTPNPYFKNPTGWSTSLVTWSTVVGPGSNQSFRETRLTPQVWDPVHGDYCRYDLDTVEQVTIYGGGSHQKGTRLQHNHVNDGVYTCYVDYFDVSPYTF